MLDQSPQNCLGRYTSSPGGGVAVSEAQQLDSVTASYHRVATLLTLKTLLSAMYSKWTDKKGRRAGDLEVNTAA